MCQVEDDDHEISKPAICQLLLHSILFLLFTIEDDIKLGTIKLSYFISQVSSQDLNSIPNPDFTGNTEWWQWSITINETRLLFSTQFVTVSKYFSRDSNNFVYCYYWNFSFLNSLVLTLVYFRKSYKETWIFNPNNHRELKKNITKVRQYYVCVCVFSRL